MSSQLIIVIALIGVALSFDFINGFHDAANSIATVVSTRVLSPGQAVVWAAFFNFVAAFGFGTAVAKTIGKGMIDISVVTFGVILGGLVGAIVWDLITWYFGLPTSSSHALIGGYARSAPARVDKVFRRLQLLSAAAYSLGHGTNDAQKTMGIIAGVLFTAGYLKVFNIPMWVILAAHTAIGLGTLSGGWRIIHTMGSKITKLQPVGGFAAETAGAATLFLASSFGIPVSTTHTITGAIVGVGATRRLSAVRWGVAGRIVWAWILTIPASALIGATVYWIVRL